MNENELTDAFAEILPEQPSTKGWAGAARRRRQQQRGITAAAVVAVLAAIAVPVTLSLGEEPQVMTTPAPSFSEAPTEDFAGDEGCFGGFSEGYPNSDLEGGKIPEGATKLWLCGGGFEGPREALTLGVDAAVEAFNDLTFVEGVAIDCASNGEVYTLVFEYPDGAVESAEGYFTPNGCQHFITSYGIIEGADTYLGTLQDLWQDQRAAGPEPGEPGYSCPGSSSAFRIELDELERGFGCAFMDTTNESGSGSIATSSDLDPETLKLIRASLPENSVPLEGGETIASDQQIVLVTAYADPIALNWGTWGGRAGFAWRNPEPMVWYPDEDLEKRVNQFFVDLEAGNDPVSTPPLLDQCARVSDEELTTTELPDGVLPDAPQDVWMCPGIESGSSLGPLVGEVNTQQMVDAFNALSETPSDVAEEPASSLDGRLIVTYSDGRRYVLRTDLNTPSVVRWGSDGDSVRYGTSEWLRGLRDLWVQQRDATQQDPPLLPTLPICENMLAGLGRGLDKYDVDAALCQAVRPPGEGIKSVEIPTAADVFARVREEAMDVRISLPEGMDGRDWNGDAIVFTDDYGDRLPLLRLAATTWAWDEGGVTYAFTPSDELAEQLDSAFGTY